MPCKPLRAIHVVSHQYRGRADLGTRQQRAQIAVFVAGMDMASDGARSAKSGSPYRRRQATVRRAARGFSFNRDAFRLRSARVVGQKQAAFVRLKKGQE